MPSELERAIAFDEVLRERCAERIVPARFGRAFFNDSYPRVWDLNFLRTYGGRHVDPGEVAADAELLHTSAGHSHRRVDAPDESVGALLEPFFRRLGWHIDREIFMAYRGGGERGADTSTVEEVSRDDLRSLREEITRGEPWATDDEVVSMVLDAGALWAGAGNARHFAMRSGGEVVSTADLYSDGRTAQVEDVATAPAHRGRGHASAVVLRAVEEAQAAGHDFVFLVTDEENWPKELYARLGFEPIGRWWSFLRTPSEARGARARSTAGS